MTDNVEGPADGLLALMNDDQNREVECQEYLKDAYPVLAPIGTSNVLQVVREQNSVVGRSDYFLLCEVLEVGIRRRLVLWEAKAPQLAPFKVATQNRLSPSRALVDAENQLLHYYDEYRSNGHLLDRYGIGHADDVRIGGIVIGRDDNWVENAASSGLSPESIKQLAASALRIRNEHFYRDKLRVLTWDRIAQVLKRGPTSYGTFPSAKSV